MINVSKQAIPKAIVHYTTLQGLVGIIENRCLWASNVSFLNDRAELTHALGEADAALSQLFKTRSMSRWRGVLSKVIEHLSNGAVPDTYATCFCTNSDKLSQWRAYGGSVQGVSITFDRAALEKRLTPDSAQFYKVRYTKITTASKLSSDISREVKDVIEWEEMLEEQAEDALYNSLLQRVSALLPKFKHIGFKDEAEWRFVVQKKCAPNKMKFRVTGNKIVPYIHIGEIKRKLPITSITVGPGIDDEATVNSIKSFTISKGYDIKVINSELTYRA